MPHCDGDPTRSKLLALFIILLTAFAITPSVSVDADSDVVYWCYGDSITLEYDGEADNVEWTVSNPSGEVLCKEKGKTVTFDGSKSDEFLAIQTVTTDQGSSVLDVKIHALHMNKLSVSVDFITDSVFYDKRVINSTTVCKNQNFISLPENPTKEGAKFGGWVYGSGEAFEATGPITEDITLHAKWLNACSIVLMSDGEVYSNLTAYEGDIVTLPSPESESHRKFKGWSTDRSNFVEFDQTRSITGDMILYAKMIRECSVLLMSDGDVYASFTADEGDTISLPVFDAKDGHEFLGWSTDKKSFVEFDPTQPITGDQVLHATWAEDEGTAGHNDMTSLIILIPVIAIIAILLFSRIHRNKVRIVPGSSKGRFGGK